MIHVPSQDETRSNNVIQFSEAVHCKTVSLFSVTIFSYYIESDPQGTAWRPVAYAVTWKTMMDAGVWHKLPANRKSDIILSTYINFVSILLLDSFVLIC